MLILWQGHHEVIQLKKQQAFVGTHTQAGMGAISVTIYSIANGIFTKPFYLHISAQWISISG